MADRVLVETEGAVARVSLNRPEKLNALDLDMFSALAETAARIGADRSIRAVVLCGAGRAFCAGIDLGAFAQGPALAAALLAPAGAGPATRAQTAAMAWRDLPQPVIASLHGQVFGGGLQIALGADLRIGAPDAQLSVMEIRWGIIPDLGGSQTLRGLLSQDQAKLLTFTGRILTGVQALALNLLTEVAEDPLAHATALAQTIAAQSPDAIRAAKHLLNEAWVGSVADGLRLEATLQRTLLGSPNQTEAVMANLERREPDFS
jgi:enoyl-CoA hydratase/carnithine racemase